jgi:hypothetical protein
MSLLGSFGIVKPLIALLKRMFSADAGQHATGSPHAQQASHSGRDIYQAGGDINVGQQVPPTPTLPWIKRPGGPVFRMSPGVNSGQLLCEFRIDATAAPGDIHARWVGAGIQMDWVTPMHDPGKYQMKGMAMSPTPPHDEVRFEVKFWLDDGEHGGRWIWPLEQQPKGHWRLEVGKGSGAGQPKCQDTW